MLDINIHVTDIKCRLASAEDIASLDPSITPLLSYSSITKYHTCPTLGALTKSIGRDSSEGYRDKALEAGSVSHEVYSAIRLYQLVQQDMPGHAWHHAERIFGLARREQMWSQLDNADPRVARYNFAMEALYSSGYVDDPFDHKRTFANIENSLHDYIGYYKYDRWPVFVLDHDDPSAFVGIEIPVVIRIDFHFEDCWPGPWTVYVDGVIDGVHYDAKNINRIIINENKTSSVIDDSWYGAFALDHQLSLYTLMTTLVMHREIHDVHLYGMPIPCGRKQSTGMSPYKRNALQHAPELFQWILTALEYHHHYKNDPLNAPRFTHSCRRYFRLCPLLPICSAPPDVRKEEVDMMPKADTAHLDRLLNSYLGMQHMFSDDRMRAATAGSSDDER